MLTYRLPRHVVVHAMLLFSEITGLSTETWGEIEHLCRHAITKAAEAAVSEEGITCGICLGDDVELGVNSVSCEADVPHHLHKECFSM